MEKTLLVLLFCINIFAVPPNGFAAQYGESGKISIKSLLDADIVFYGTTKKQSKKTIQPWGDNEYFWDEKYFILQTEATETLKGKHDKSSSSILMHYICPMDIDKNYEFLFVGEKLNIPRDDGTFQPYTQLKICPVKRSSMRSDLVKAIDKILR